MEEMGIQPNPRGPTRLAHPLPDLRPRALISAIFLGLGFAPTFIGDAVSAQDELSFHSAVNVSGPEWDILTYVAGIPSLTASASSSTLAWLGVSPVGFEVRYADVGSLGTGWEVMDLRADGPKAANSVRISAAQNRTVLTEKVSEGPVQVWTRGAGEVGFTAGGVLPAPDGIYSVLVVDSNRVFVAGGNPGGGGFVRLYRSTDGGMGFDAGTDISLARSGVTDVRLFAANLNEIGACWIDLRNGNPDVFATVIDLNSSGVRTPARVDDTGLDSSVQGEPDCAFMPDGRVLAVWKDARSAPPGDFDLYAALSSADRRSFGPSMRIDDAPPTTVAHQARPTLVVDGDSVSYVAFEDDRDLEKRLYYASISLVNGTLAPGKNHLVPDAEPPALFPAMARTLAGTIYLSWQGPRATVMLSTARGPSAGPGGAPRCEWIGAPMLEAAGSPGRYAVVADDPEGWQTILDVAVSLDGATVSASYHLPLAEVTVDPRSLSLGNHSAEALFRDRDGMEGRCSYTITVVLGNSSNGRPMVEIVSPLEFQTNVSDTVRIEGRVVDPEGDAISLYVSMDGSPWSPLAHGANWTHEVSAEKLSKGSHRFVFVAADPYGISAPASREITIVRPGATNPPTCRILLPTMGTPVSRNVSIVGVVSDIDGPNDILDASFIVFPAGISGALFRFEPFVAEFAVPGWLDGFTFRVNMTDREGRVGECSRSFAVSGNPVESPNLKIIRPLGGTVYVDPETIRIEGTASASSGTVESIMLWLPGEGQVLANGADSWGFSWNVSGLASGTYFLFAFATDSDGRVSRGDQVAVSIVRLQDGKNTPLVAVMSIVTSPSPPSVGEATVILVDATNFGGGPLDHLGYRVTVVPVGNQSDESNYVRVGEFSLPAGAQNVTIEIPWQPPAPGEYEIRVELNYEMKVPAAFVVKDQGSARVYVTSAGGGLLAPIASALVWTLLVAVAVAVSYAIYRSRARRDDERQPNGKQGR